MVKLVIFITILRILASAQHISTSQIDIQKHDQEQFLQKKFACITDQKLTVIKRNQTLLQSRLLQSTDPHGFRIYGAFASGAAAAAVPDWSIINRMFKIAVKYFNMVIKVTTLTQDQTKFSGGGSCGSTAMSEQLINNGFDPEGYDSTIFVEGVNDASQGYVAQAAPCLLTRWPVYGFIRFNYAYLQTDLNNKGSFHNGIFTVVHQLTHIYALNPNLFELYYTSYNSGTTLGQSNVISLRPGSTDTYMVISPNVQAYVASYFTCADNTIGAVLEDEGGSGSANSHWDRKVYFNELMTASTWPSNLKITALTLNLFKDTGFFHTIDTTISDTPTFGAGKGCTFATGDIQPSPEFCTGTADACGYYNTYIGSCSDADAYSNSVSFVRAYSNGVCVNPDLPDAGSNTFSPASRCFDLVSGDHHCYTAECTVNGIEINIGGTIVICGSGDSTITTPAGQINCPDNNVFCSVKSCNNDWCDTKGICVNGQCINQEFVDTISEALNIDVSEEFIISIGATAGFALIFFIIICCVGRANAPKVEQAVSEVENLEDGSQNERQFIKAQNVGEIDN